jgi:hypothetical protein
MYVEMGSISERREKVSERMDGISERQKKLVLNC